jgi:hypothetical protein
MATAIELIKATFNETPKGRRYRRSFLVTFDNPATILQAANFTHPKLPSPWGHFVDFDDGVLRQYLGAFFESRDILMEEDGRGFTADFVWATPSNGTRETAENPLEDPARLTLVGETFQRVLTRDLSTPPKLIANSTGQMFEEGLPVDETQWVLKIERNEADVDVVGLAAYANALNDAEFYGLPIGTWKMKPITIPVKQSRNDISYFPMTYEILYSKYGHQPKVLDRGHSHLVELPDSTLERRENVQTQSGQQERECLLLKNASLLNGTGRILPSGGDPEQYLSFVGYQEQDFDALGLEYSF